MADQDKGAPEITSDQAMIPPESRGGGPGIRVMAQFVRDLSFENPRAPDSLRGDTAPKIDLDVELAARTRPDGLYEIDLKLIVAATRGPDAVFHVEVLYGGLFEIGGIPDTEMEAVLLIECPRYLFPFARRLIADLTGEGGFPPFRVDPIDFAGIYMARRAEMEKNGGASPIQQA